MTRKFGVFGLVFVAALAMSAVAASVSSGKATEANFTAESYPVTIHGHSPVNNEELITEGGTVKCTGEFHAVLNGPSQTLTATPTYSSCVAFGFVEASVAMNGCAYEFHLTTEIAGTPDPTYQAHADLECPKEKAVKIVASSCEVTIEAQPGLTTVDLINDTGATPKKDVTVRPTIGGVNYTVTKDGFLCPFNGTGAKTGAELKGNENVTVTGQKLAPEGATKVGIDIG